MGRALFEPIKYPNSEEIKELRREKHNVKVIDAWLNNKINDDELKRLIK